MRNIAAWVIVGFVIFLFSCFVKIGFELNKYETRMDAAAVTLAVPTPILNMANSTVMVTGTKGGIEGSGSGVIISYNGIVATARHVVDGTDDIAVVLPDGSVLPVRYSIVSDTSDCALLFTGEVTETYSKLSHDLLQQGERVYVCGSPFGRLYHNYMTSGVISKCVVTNQFFSTTDLCMIDAPINPGNSGGPVFNEAGEVIGLAIGSDTRGDALNYVTPICEIVELLDIIKPVY